MDPDKQMLQEAYRLVKENNHMLHAMRRNAFIGGVLKLLLYAALLFVPFWFYMTYLNGVVQQMLQAMQQLQGTGAKAQMQVSDLGKTWKDLQDKLPGFMQTPSTSTSQ
ncbi:MAG: hypothetical protein RLZZ416_80 [Candidatus Parcubacteria bacterium]|jgi:hypothetical protein